METTSKTSELDDWIIKANEFVNNKMGRLSLSDRVATSREGKRIVLAINDFYKKNQNPELMIIMKAVTEKKQKVEKRLKIRQS